MTAAQTLSGLAVGILTCAEPSGKVSRTAELAELWRNGSLAIGACAPPDRPTRPQRPELRRPGDMPKRSTGPRGRIALVHALAHIELNAIDLAWDILVRFTREDLPRDFYDDWIGVAADEAQHFAMLVSRLERLEARYGDLPAHDSLWEASSLTADDLLARLALIPMTLEARGIDTTPATCVRLRQAGDEDTAAILDKIYVDEIKHLSVGIRWFEFLCDRRSLNPQDTYHAILTERFTGTLRGPFNLTARAEANMTADYLHPWLKAA